MRTLLQWLRGRVTVVITGAEVEGFLNLCAREGVLFWGVERRGPFTLVIQTTWRESRHLAAIAQRAQCTLAREGAAGLPPFLLGFRRRYALAAGAVLCLLGLCVLSRFVWTIDITGNERVTQGEILTELRRWGVKIGAYAPAIKEREVANRVLLALDDLSFCALNFHGTRAEVIVREKIPLPDLVDEDQPASVVSAANGVILHIEPRMGQARFREGDAVLAGEVLISGVVDIEEPEFSEVDLGTYTVHAQGRVMARTWRTIAASIPLTVPTKVYTGEETHGLAVRFLGRRLKIFGNGGICAGEYDKITETKSWTTAAGRLLPFGWEWETCRRYTITHQPLEEETARAMLETQLLAALAGELEEGVIEKTDFVAQKDDACLTVTLLAQCTEQIGRSVPLEEGAPPVEDPPVRGGG